MSSTGFLLPSFLLPRSPSFSQDPQDLASHLQQSHQNTAKPDLDPLRILSRGLKS